MRYRGTHVCVTSGMRGFFALLVDDAGPVQSGVGSYMTAEQAEVEAREWALTEGIPFEGKPVYKPTQRDA